MNIRALAILCLATACTQSTPDAKSDTAATAEAKTDAKTDEGKADAGDDKAATDKPKPRGKQVPPPEDVAAPPADATKTASGLAYKILQKGTGETTPTPNDSVKVLMTGWSTDGTTVETTESTGKPKTMPMGKSMPGLSEGLALMHAGERARFWIPEELDQWSNGLPVIEQAKRFCCPGPHTCICVFQHTNQRLHASSVTRISERFCCAHPAVGIAAGQ